MSNLGTVGTTMNRNLSNSKDSNDEAKQVIGPQCPQAHVRGRLGHRTSLEQQDDTRGRPFQATTTDWMLIPSFEGQPIS